MWPQLFVGKIKYARLDKDSHVSNNLHPTAPRIFLKAVKSNKIPPAVPAVGLEETPANPRTSLALRKRPFKKEEEKETFSMASS